MSPRDDQYMRLALGHARKGFGRTSPNPMVGAVLVKRGQIIGRGWHHGPGQAHAEIEALHDCAKRGLAANGATLYVSLEPCCTQGRTPPCTDAIIGSGIKRVVVGATDPNPRHCGRGFRILQDAGICVAHGILAAECADLNEAFNHWIVHRTPFVTVKAAMTLDGKIATSTGESKWITDSQARAYGMKLRQGSDAILVGINTILADDPSLSVRTLDGEGRKGREPKAAASIKATRNGQAAAKELRRIVLDADARTPLQARVVSDALAFLTTIVVAESAPPKRVRELAKRVRVLIAAVSRPHRDQAGDSSNRKWIDLPWLLRKLGSEEISGLLVEGGGEVNASFLFQGLTHRIAFFYAPKILGGRNSRRAVAGPGARNISEIIDLTQTRWRRLGVDWLLTARTKSSR